MAASRKAPNKDDGALRRAVEEALQTSFVLRTAKHAVSEKLLQSSVARDARKGARPPAEPPAPPTVLGK